MRYDDARRRVMSAVGREPGQKEWLSKGVCVPVRTL